VVFAPGGEAPLHEAGPLGGSIEHRALGNATRKPFHAGGDVSRHVACQHRLARTGGAEHASEFTGANEAAEKPILPGSGIDLAEHR
jgi:hypothetical protein